MEALFALLMVFGVLVVLPLLFLKLFFGLIWTVVSLPFRIAGAVLHLVFGVLGGLAKAFGSLVFVLAALFCGLLLVVALPLLPLVILFGGIWLLAKALRPTYRPA